MYYQLAYIFLLSVLGSFICVCSFLKKKEQKKRQRHRKMLKKSGNAMNSWTLFDEMHSSSCSCRWCRAKRNNEVIEDEDC